MQRPANANTPTTTSPEPQRMNIRQKTTICKKTGIEPDSPCPQKTNHSPLRLCHMGLLTAFALVLAASEALLPLNVGVPGIKLGLSNIVVVFALFTLSTRDAGIIMVVKTVLAALLTGQIATLPFGLAGGIAAFVAALIFRRLLTMGSMRSCSIVSSLAHTITQLGVALAITATPGVVFFAPYLTVAAVVTGFITGTAATALFDRSVPFLRSGLLLEDSGISRRERSGSRRRSRTRSSVSGYNVRTTETKGSAAWESTS